MRHAGVSHQDFLKTSAVNTTAEIDIFAIHGKFRIQFSQGSWQMPGEEQTRPGEQWHSRSDASIIRQPSVFHQNRRKRKPLPQARPVQKFRPGRRIGPPRAPVIPARGVENTRAQQPGFPVRFSVPDEPGDAARMREHVRIQQQRVASADQRQPLIRRRGVKQIAIIRHQPHVRKLRPHQRRRPV